MNWRTKLRQELTADPVKEIHEERDLGGSGSGLFRLSMKLRVETLGGKIFSSSDVELFEKIKDRSEKERVLEDRLYQGAVDALTVMP